MRGHLQRGAGLLGAALLSAIAVKSCALPDDFVKAAAGGAAGEGGASGGAGGIGGGAGAGGEAPGECPPHAGVVPDACSEGLFDDRHNCCFAGRDCGPDTVTNCVAGDCSAYPLSTPAPIAPLEGSGITLLGGFVVFGYKHESMPAEDGYILKVPEAGGSAEELGHSIFWSPTQLVNDGAQVFFLNEHTNDLWAIDLEGSSRIVATAMGAGDAGQGHLTVADGNVFFALESGGIWRAGVGDTEAPAAKIVEADNPIGVAVEPGHVYFTERTNGRLLGADPDGAAAQVPVDVVASADVGSNPGAVQVHGNQLFWVTDADIRRANRDGSDPGVLVPNEVVGCFNCITSLHVDDRYVYFASWDLVTATGAYYRMPRYPSGAPAPAQLIGDDGPAPFEIAASCDRLFAVHIDGSVTTVTK